jgi:hypothetical protein
MRHVCDVTRLKGGRDASREIARRVARGRPRRCRLTIRLFEATGLTWPLPDVVTDAVLEPVYSQGPATAAGRTSGVWPNRTGHSCTASCGAST